MKSLFFLVKSPSFLGFPRVCHSATMPRYALLGYRCRLRRSQGDLGDLRAGGDLLSQDLEEKSMYCLYFVYIYIFIIINHYLTIISKLLVITTG